MIDAHMHMDYFDWHTVREEVYTQSEEAKTLAIARCAEKALRRALPPYATLAVSPATDMAFWM